MDLFETFLQEKKFLNGVTPKTISTYQCAYKAYQRVAGNELPTKQSLKQFVIQMQKNGMSVCGINSYARSLNSFLSWLYKENYVSEPLM